MPDAIARASGPPGVVTTTIANDRPVAADPPIGDDERRLGARERPGAADPDQADGRRLMLGFALMPNRLGYCGGDDQRELRDYYVAGRADAGLARLLHRFEGAMPYLRLIARANAVADPLDRRVVEAYWLGNDLLARTDLPAFHASLRERFAGRVSPRSLDYLLGKVPAGALPHHNFHVFETYLRTATLPAGLETLDQCRIAWGTVLSATPREAVVLSRPLLWNSSGTGDRLVLGEPCPRTLVRHLDGYTALPDLAAGDVVAIHWGWAAAKLRPDQVAALAWQTRHHLALANQTL
jgi:hypothetical protein